MKAPLAEIPAGWRIRRVDARVGYGTPGAPRYRVRIALLTGTGERRSQERATAALLEDGRWLVAVGVSPGGFPHLERPTLGEALAARAEHDARQTEGRARLAEQVRREAEQPRGPEGAPALPAGWKWEGGQHWSPWLATHVGPCSGPRVYTRWERRFDGSQWVCRWETSYNTSAPTAWVPGAAWEPGVEAAAEAALAASRERSRAATEALIERERAAEIARLTERLALLRRIRSAADFSVRKIERTEYVPEHTPPDERVTYPAGNVTRQYLVAAGGGERFERLLAVDEQAGPDLLGREIGETERALAARQA